MKIADYSVTSSKLCETIKGSLRGPEKNIIDGYTLDSREVAANDVFFAVVGERFNGNDFIEQVAEKKPGAIVYSEDPAVFNPEIAYIKVADTTVALSLFASAYKETISPFTVAVTGSVGKTTTRQLIYSVLSKEYNTCVTKGNLNNEIGLPKTLLTLTKENTALVAELGMNHRGEIERLSKTVRPDISVITTIGTSHIEFLGSREGIRDAKMEIKCGMSEDGVIIGDGDEPLLDGLIDVYCSIKNENSDFYANNIREFEDKTLFDAHYADETVKDICIPILGKFAVKDALYAIAVGVTSGISAEKIKEGLFEYEKVGYRQNISKHSNNITVIEDCYNAAPESMKSSIDVLVSLAMKKGGRAVAVLGDMGELGENSLPLHRSVGEYIEKAGDITVLTYGEDSVYISDKNHFAKEQSGDLLEYLKSIIRENDTVLFKASRFMEMEKISQKFKEEL